MTDNILDTHVIVTEHRHQTSLICGRLCQSQRICLSFSIRRHHDQSTCELLSAMSERGTIVSTPGYSHYDLNMAP